MPMFFYTSLSSQPPDQITLGAAAQDATGGFNVQNTPIPSTVTLSAAAQSATGGFNVLNTQFVTATLGAAAQQVTGGFNVLNNTVTNAATLGAVAGNATTALGVLNTPIPSAVTLTAAAQTPFVVFTAQMTPAAVATTLVAASQTATTQFTANAAIPAFLTLQAVAQPASVTFAVDLINANAIDLVSLATAETSLGNALPGYLTPEQIAILITEASSQIIAFAKRDFKQKNYVEIRDSRGFSSIFTRQYPTNYITRLAISPTTVLSIQNTNSQINQRATAYLTVTGDVATGQTATGFTLIRVASGVTTVDTSVTFDLYPTLQAVAAAITALGNGWTATVAGGYALWPSADFLPNQGVQNCLLGGQGDFAQYVTDVSDYQVNGLSGEIRFNNTSYDPVFALMNVFSPNNLVGFPNGWQNIRVEYNAGYATVPQAVQMATLLTVRDWATNLSMQTQYEQERLDEWMGRLSDIFKQGLPQSARDILLGGGWVSYRNF